MPLDSAHRREVRAEEVRLVRGLPSAFGTTTAFSAGPANDETRRGLRLYASVLGGVCVASFALQFLGEVVFGSLGWSAADWIRESSEALLQGALAVLVYRAAGSATLSVEVKRGLALGLYVLYVAISTFYDVMYLDTTHFAIRPGWSCLAILMYALLAPGSTRHHGIVAASAVVAIPLGAILAWVFGLLEADSGGWLAFATLSTSALGAMTPSLVCAVVAVSIVHTSRRKTLRWEKMKQTLLSLGSYRLVGRIGHGGMGEVWRAEHAFLATPAAVKLIRPELLDRPSRYESPDILLQRFFLEAHSIARLTSPHTVRLYDFGQTPDGTLFLAMELLDGEDLETVVRTMGALPEARVVHLLLQACDSLGEAHGVGLIHRDIKPANLFVCRRGLRSDVLKVLDFGLALSVEAKVEDSDRPRVTEQGLVQGTAWYMAPEQSMSAEGLDHRADLYALGCVAYFLLTGTEVFQTRSASKVLRMHCTQPPDRLEVRRPDVAFTPDLQRLVMDLLAKERDLRPRDAGELERRLRALPIAPWTNEDAERAERALRNRLDGSPPVSAVESSATRRRGT
jgi:serine/threonine protein kinase